VKKKYGGWEKKSSTLKLPNGPGPLCFFPILHSRFSISVSQLQSATTSLLTHRRRLLRSSSGLNIISVAFRIPHKRRELLVRVLSTQRSSSSLSATPSSFNRGISFSLCNLSTLLLQSLLCFLSDLGFCV
jgi:hypothetical protein